MTSMGLLSLLGCPACGSEPTVHVGRDHDLQEDIFECQACGHVFREVIE